MPPRKAYSPLSRTVEAREKPLDSSQAREHLHDRRRRRARPKNSWPPFRWRGGTRWVSALTVVTQQARSLERGAGARQPRQRGHALRGDRRRRRHAIIGLAIPGRKFEDFRFRRGEGQGFAEGAQALAVAGDVDQREDRPFPGLSQSRGEDRRRRRRRTRPARAKKSASGSFQARQGRVAVFSCCFSEPLFNPRPEEAPFGS